MTNDFPPRDHNREERESHEQVKAADDRFFGDDSTVEECDPDYYQEEYEFELEMGKLSAGEYDLPSNLKELVKKNYSNIFARAANKAEREHNYWRYIA